MKRISNNETAMGTQLTLDIPLHDNQLFAGEATEDILLTLIRQYDESFSITELAELLTYSRPTVSKTVDVLSSNDLVVENREGTRRLVQINRDRVIRPDEPYLEIPQSEFQLPVRNATEALLDDLDDILAIVLYGSVARGEADRRSDIDLWVLVREDRMTNQRRANQLRQSLEEQSFEGSRYAFDIDVEGLRAVPNYTEDIREILRDSIPIYRTDEFETVRSMVFHGNFDE